VFVDGVPLVQVHQRAYRPHQALGGGPVGDDLTG
jgi:hypothetical protein